MKNILIATDFSNNAYNALFHATQLLNGKPGTFYLVHAYDEHTTIQSNKGGKNLIQQLADESNEGLQQTFHRIQRDDTDPKHIFNTISAKGVLTDIIMNTINEKSIDLVIMGNSGCSEIEAIFLGSNVLRAIRDIKKRPILTIPKEMDFKAPKEIAFVTDHKNKYDAGLLEPLRFIATQFKSKIRIMHINEEERLSDTQHINRGLLLAYLSDFEYSLNWMPLFKSKTTAIHNFLEEMNIDMLIMVNYEHSFLERMSHEPVIKRMAFDLDIPFLVIPYHD